MKPLRTSICIALFALIFVASIQSIRAATFTVDTSADDNSLSACTAAVGDCSLRGAITAANALAGADTIILSAGTYTLTVASTSEDANIDGDLDIIAGSSITIAGADARSTIIQAGTIGGVSGNGIDRVFDILATGSLSIDNVTVRNGRAPAAGGGIRNAGNLAISHVSIANNRTTTSGGGGIEILTATTTTILHSTISGNSIGSSSGGGIRTIGTAQLSIANTTISGNTAFQTGGGAIRTQSGAGGLITITNCTVTGNVLLSNTGGGISNSNTLQIRNTIISGNTGGTQPDVNNGAFVSGGSNLIGVAGTSTGWVGSDLLNNTNAKLGPLQNNGGTTDTHFLDASSSAIDAGQVCITDISCPTFNAPAFLPSDERGAVRPGNPDIGSFEVNAAYIADLPVGSVAFPYSQSVVPESGVFTYCVSTGILPPGLTGISSCSPPFQARGFAPAALTAINGLPTTVGTYNFALTGTNGAITGTTNYRLVINAHPSAANVSVSGRVLTPSGSGLTNAIVTLTDINGNVRRVRSSSFGYYRFDDVAAGETYLIGAASKRFVFTAQILTVGDDLAGVDLIGE